jgi:hypothetical protein
MKQRVAIGNMMVSEALNSLTEAKLQLQRQLAQRQEYRALLVIDKATRQIAEILDPLPQPVAPLQSSAKEEPAPPFLAAKTKDAAPEVAPSEDRVGEAAPIEMAGAVGESPSAPSSSFACVEDRVLEAPLPAQALAEETVTVGSRAIDLFLSSTAQAASIAAPPRPRSFLPFVAAPRLVKSASGAN